MIDSSDRCPICGGLHPAHLPHDPQRLEFQQWFHRQHGRFPSWKDAAAHCCQEDREFFLYHLKKVFGVDVDAEAPLIWHRAS